MDANSNPPKILVDSVRTDFELKVSADADGADPEMPPLPLGNSQPVHPAPKPTVPRNNVV